MQVLVYVHVADYNCYEWTAKLFQKSRANNLD